MDRDPREADPVDTKPPDTDPAGTEVTVPVEEEPRSSPVEVRALAGMLAAVGCAGTALTAARWHSPENFFQFNARSIPWSYLWSIGLLAAVLFAVTVVLLRGVLAALAWVGGAMLALSVVGLVESFWFAFQVLQGDGATRVLQFARGYVVVFAIALVVTWASVGLSRRRPPRGPGGPIPASGGSDGRGRLSG